MGKLIDLECFKQTAGCGAKEVAGLVNLILKNLVIIGMFVAAVMISYTGWILFKGMGDPAARSKARGKLLNIVIGLIILFSAYFIVSLILTQFGVTDPLIRKSGV